MMPTRTSTTDPELLREEAASCVLLAIHTLNEGARLALRAGLPDLSAEIADHADDLAELKDLVSA